MRGRWLRLLAVLGLAVCAAASAQADSFHWVDFHSPKDQSVVIWVTHALAGEQWTAIREIGVQYDAALVVTTERSAPDASPDADTFHIWSVSLTNHLLTSLLKGVNLRWVDSMQLSPGAAREPAAMFEDCLQCAATTYFTAFRYDVKQHAFTARWMRGAQAAPVWTSAVPQGVALTQLYAMLPAADGGQFLATWSRYDYGGKKPVQDYIYRYDRDPFTGLDRVLMLSGKDEDAMKQRICDARQENATLARGQDAVFCQAYAHVRTGWKPVTTPPANNQGQSVPPGAGHKRN